MKKNLLSIAILVLALIIVGINFGKTFSAKEETVPSVDQENITVDEDVPGVDLSQVQVGNPAPDFTLMNIEGKNVTLSDYRGKKVILNFWATWCPPCKAEMPHMQNFYENNKDNGIEIIAVNLTSMDNGQESINSFVKEYGLTFTIPLDVDGDIGKQYQAFTIPTSYIIDSKGIIENKIVGPMDENMMENLTSK